MIIKTKNSIIKSINTTQIPKRSLIVTLTPTYYTRRIVKIPSGNPRVCVTMLNLVRTSDTDVFKEIVVKLLKRVNEEEVTLLIKVKVHREGTVL